MAHELDMSNNRANMAYTATGGTPWHGLGASMPDGATLDEWLNAAGLTWTADMVPIAFKPNGHWESADKHRACVRSDTGALLGIHSDRWKPVQPATIAKAIADVMPIETLGSLKGGTKIWALGKNTLNFKVKGVDEVRNHLLVTTGFDGSLATHWRFCRKRVVCHNTWTVAMAEGINRAERGTVRHSTEFKLDDFQRAIGMMESDTAMVEEQANKLAESRLSRATVDKLLVDWFGRPEYADKPVDANNMTTNSHNVIQDVTRCIVDSPGSNLDSARGTAWGVFNGVTRYIDFEARTKGQGMQRADNRLHSAWYGAGAQVKVDAWRDLLAECVGMTVQPHTSILDGVTQATVQ